MIDYHTEFEAGCLARDEAGWVGFSPAETIRCQSQEAQVLRTALKQIKHSVSQAKIPGNDWKRELKLIENAISEVNATLGDII